MSVRGIQLSIIVVTLVITLVFLRQALVTAAIGQDDTRTAQQTLEGDFSPSNARTESGGLIPVEQFIPSTRCQSCHQDTHSAWSESLHRNAAREPFTAKAPTFCCACAA